MATEEQKTELEKICADLETKITAKNQELADLNKSIHARIDSGDGDIRLSKLVLEKEIRDLEAKKVNLSGIVTAALAEVTAEKIRLAGEAEGIKTQRNGLSDQLHDIESREVELKSKKEKYEAEIISINARYDGLKEAEDKAFKDRNEASQKLGEADRILKEAHAKQAGADTAVADLTAQANAKLKDAEAIRAAAEEKEKSVTAQIAEVEKLKAEYTAKLEASQTWAMDNSKVSDKLSSWEGALRSEYDKLQDEQGKLAIAERDFANKLKRGN